MNTATTPDLGTTTPGTPNPGTVTSTRRRLGRRARLAIGAAIVATVALPVAAGAVPGFDDVPDDHTHNDGIQWLVDNGITLGCDGDSFCPSDAVTRGQMASFMHRLSGHAAGVTPSVDADTVDGKHANELGGLSDVTMVESKVTLAAGDAFESHKAVCGAGQIPISGGYTLLNGPGNGAGLAPADWFVVDNEPADDGWFVAVRYKDGGGPATDDALNVHVVCATP